MTRKWLILPCEVVERELNGKLLICREAMARGWGCIIGTNKAIAESVAALPKGVFFIKSVQSHELPFIKSLRAMGHHVTCLDEEGLVQNNLDHMLLVRSTKETINELAAFLFWGKVQCDAHINMYPEFKDRLFVTGNPRADLWEKEKYRVLYADEIQKIRNTYGKYFIIPTSFGTYNHFMGFEGAMSVYRAGNLIDSEEHREFLENYRLYIKNIYEGFIDLIDPLSKKFPDMSIIVRPHPSENRKPWDELAKSYDNVHVVFSGGVTPWLLGAEAVIHCGSTTAVEAHLLGRPVISYCRDYSDPQYALEVPAKISINVTSADEVLDVLQKVTEGQDVKALYPEVADGHEWLKGWTDNVDSGDSSVKIVDALDGIAMQGVAYQPRKIPVKIKPDTRKLKDMVWFCFRIFEYIPVVKDILPFRIKFGLKNKHYSRNKTRDMNPADIKSFLDKLDDIDGQMNVKVDVLRKNIIALTPE